MNKDNMEEKIYELNKEGQQQQKAKYVRGMFDDIAAKYDFMNHLMTGGIDIYWREFSIKKIKLQPGDKVLDVCTGTCDLALTAAKYVGIEGEIIGVDLSEGMLRVGLQKIQKLKKRPFMALTQGRAESLPFKDNYFDAVVVTCGLRNTTDIPLSLSEMVRVVKKGGVIFNLDLGHPPNYLFNKFYHFYFFRIIPLMGKLLAHREAYSYLPNSLLTFPNQEKLKKIFEDVGLQRVQYYNLLGGAMALHVGYKE